MEKLSDADIRNLRCAGWKIQLQQLNKQGAAPVVGAWQKQGILGNNANNLITPTSQLVANNGVAGTLPNPQAQQAVSGNSARMATLPGPPGSVAQGPVNSYGPLSTGQGPVALDGNHSRGLSKQMGMLG